MQPACHFYYSATLQFFIYNQSVILESMVRKFPLLGEWNLTIHCVGSARRWWSNTFIVLVGHRAEYFQ